MNLKNVISQARSGVIQYTSHFKKYFLSKIASNPIKELSLNLLRLTGIIAQILFLEWLYGVCVSLANSDSTTNGFERCEGSNVLIQQYSDLLNPTSSTITDSNFSCIPKNLIQAEFTESSPLIGGGSSRIFHAFFEYIQLEDLDLSATELPDDKRSVLTLNT